MKRYDDNKVLISCNTGMMNNALYFKIYGILQGIMQLFSLFIQVVLVFKISPIQQNMRYSERLWRLFPKSLYYRRS